MVLLHGVHVFFTRRVSLDGMYILFNGIPLPCGVQVCFTGMVLRDQVRQTIPPPPSLFLETFGVVKTLWYCVVDNKRLACQIALTLALKKKEKRLACQIAHLGPGKAQRPPGFFMFRLDSVNISFESHHVRAVRRLRSNAASARRLCRNAAPSAPTRLVRMSAISHVRPNLTSKPA